MRSPKRDTLCTRPLEHTYINTLPETVGFNYYLNSSECVRRESLMLSNNGTKMFLPVIAY